MKCIGFIIFIIFQIFSQYFYPIDDQVISAYAQQSDQQEENISLPILMFHAFTTDEKEVQYTIITDKKFEETISILQDNGYESISFKQLTNYIKNGEKLPKKPYMITVDDGYLDNYEIMYPILKQKNEKALISLIGDKIGNRDPAYGLPKLGWKEINEMLKSGFVEFGNHTYGMHDLTEAYNGDRNGGIINNGETHSQYAKSFNEDVKKLNELLKEKCGIDCNVFCYPFGYFDDLSEALISGLGFEASLTTDQGMNFINRNSKLTLLKRYNITMNTDVNKLISEWENQ